MAKTDMPTAEAEVIADTTDSANADDERVSYELAFHVLPTVVEGEVSAIFDAIKQLVVDAGGEIIDEEMPQRFDLAYEITKYVEGKYRKFGSAYFGWVRCKLDASAIEALGNAVESRLDILRHLIIRLTREEEAHAFRFHEALASNKQVTDVEEKEVTDDGDSSDDEVTESDSDEALDNDEA